MVVTISSDFDKTGKYLHLQSNFQSAELLVVPEKIFFRIRMIFTA